MGINTNILFVILAKFAKFENGDWVLSHVGIKININILFVLYWLNFQNLEYTTYSLENFENIHACTLSMVIGSSLIGINIDISFVLQTSNPLCNIN